MVSFLSYLTNKDIQSEKHPFEGLAYMRFFPRLARELPRVTAFASEVGEGIRPVVHPNIVRTAYGISLLYVGIDTAVKVGNHYDVKNNCFSPIAKYQLFDTSLFHASASMIVPAVTIHSGVNFAKKACNRLKTSVKFAKIAPVFFGLAMIPVIIGPIDHGTDYLMDRFIRSMYPKDVQNNLYK